MTSMRLPIACFTALVSVLGCAAPPKPEPAITPVVIATPPAAARSAPEPADRPAAAPKAVEPASAPIEVAFRRALLAEVGGSGEPDAALFVRGNELEANDPAGARRAYFELIQQMPTSPLVPYAYLAFSDLFFAEANGDPSRFALAQQAYQEVVKYPPPRNRAYAYAWYRLGVVFARLREHARVLDAEKKAIVAVLADRSLPLAERIREAAGDELVLAYAAAGDPARALVFLKGADAANTFRNVTALGDAYARNGALRELVLLYDGPLAATPLEELCVPALAALRSLRSGLDTGQTVTVTQTEARWSQLCARIR
jgi:tetratricopeptide (TPR) repeat protein